MSYITRDDLLKVISDTELTEILDNESPTLLTDSLAIAESEAVSYLSRYDAASGFAMSGNTRDSLLVVRLADIALYHMYSVISPRDVPDLRQRRYTEACKYLDAVSKGNRDLISFPLKTDPEGKASFIKWGNSSRANGFDFYG